MKSFSHATITSKGQITVPLYIRDKFNLSAGSKLEFLSREDYIIVLPVNQSMESLKGILPKPDKTLSCEEMNVIIKHRILK